MNLRAFLMAILLFPLLAVFHAQAQTHGNGVSPSGKYEPSPTPTNANPEAAAEILKQALNVQQIGPDTFTLGRVVFDKKERTVKIPSRVNMRQGVVEYALVSDMGKKHESVFATEVKPHQAHIACLLLGITATNLSGQPNVPCPVPAPNAVQIEVAWETNGTSQHYPLAELIVMHPEPAAGVSSSTNLDAVSKPLSAGAWFYNGSFFGPTAFQAQAEGSFISLIRDPAALVNNPRSDLDNDKIHYPNLPLLPAEGTPVDIILRFPKAQ